MIGNLLSVELHRKNGLRGNKMGQTQEERDFEISRERHDQICDLLGKILEQLQNLTYLIKEYK